MDRFTVGHAPDDVKGDLNQALLSLSLVLLMLEFPVIVVFVSEMTYKASTGTLYHTIMNSFDQFDVSLHNKLHTDYKNPTTVSPDTLVDWNF